MQGAQNIWSQIRVLEKHSETFQNNSDRSIVWRACKEQSFVEIEKQIRAN